MSIFGSRLKNLRNKAGLRQDEMGSIIGKSRETISKYESGEREPDMDTIITMAEYFNVTTDYLLGISDHAGDGKDSAEEQYLYPELKPLKPYFKDSKFIRYLMLAVKLKDNDVDISSLERLVDDIIRLKRKAVSKYKRTQK